MPVLDTDVVHHLEKVLDIHVPGVRPSARVNELPYFLHNAFQFGELGLLGHPVILAMGRAEAKQSLGQVRTWLDKVTALAGQPVVYVTDALASYDRRRLIEQKVPFIVPGNQLYLPDLGLDLREHFRKSAADKATAPSPSAQAIMITALLRQPWQPEWQLWSYSPALLADTATVVPLSLMLSLQVNADDRIQLALDKQKGQLPC